MVGRPAARINDLTAHLLPWTLTPGLPSLNVIIGKQPAWKGAPGGAGASLKDFKNDSEDRIRKGEAACKLAGETPQAKTALEALKVKEQAEMAKKILDAAAGGSSIHMCVSVAPIPIGIPHGPGLVINGSPTVLINGLPACRLGDEILEAFGPKNFIMTGQMNVLIGDRATPSLAASMAAALAALQNLNLAAIKLQKLLMELMANNLALAAATAQMQSALANIQALTRLMGDLMASGAPPNVRAAAAALIGVNSQIIAGAAQAAQEFQKASAETAAKIGSEIANGVGKAAQEFQKGIQEAAQKEADRLKSLPERLEKRYDQASGTIDKVAEKDGPAGLIGRELQERRDALEKKAENLEKLPENVEKRYDQASKTIDKVAETDGPAGLVGRELQERRDTMEKKARNAEELAGRGAEAAQESARKAQEAERKAWDKAQQTKQAAEKQAAEAAKQLGDLTQGFADGLNGTPAGPDDHHGHDHGPDARM